MRLSLVLATLALAVLLTAPAIATGPTRHTYNGNYTLALDGTLIFSRSDGNVFAGNPALGGLIFPSHIHDTTAAIAVFDQVFGLIPAVVCQDINSDNLCDTRSGSPDVWRCIAAGTTSGFPIVKGEAATISPPAPAKPRNVFVFVASPAFTVPECGGVQGKGTTGSISLVYS